jgi:hypothetical protein
MRKIVGLTIATTLGVALLAAGSAWAASGSTKTKTKTKTVTIHLTGKAASKGAAKGSGVFRFQLVSKTSLLCYSLTWKNIDTPVASDVHKGAAGKSGPVTVALSSTAPVSNSGCVKVTKSLLTAIGKTPSAYYVLVTTKKYPKGAIRGQL